jgi:hypothetical protein
MAGDQGRWDVVSRVSDVIALVGFAVPLIVSILQAHGVIAVSQDRETLIIGGVVAAILATFFLCVAVAKYYFVRYGTQRFHHPRWDVLAFVVFALLATFCFITSPASPAASPSQHRGTVTAVIGY